MNFSDVLQKFITSIEANGLGQTDLESIQELVSGCSVVEVREHPGKFASLCHQITEALITTRRSVMGIDLMINCIIKLRSNRYQLTSIHSDLCMLSLDSKNLNQALPFLDDDYTEINKEDGGFEMKHVLSYHYYGGMIYTALKNFDRASQFFEIILTIQTPSITQYAQEAFKKLVILSLLVYGKVPEDVMSKRRKINAPAYLKLAHEYKSFNYEKIMNFINTNTENFERDENFGLIKQCLTQVRTQNIQRLTKTFLTLSLRDVANLVGLATEDDAEMLILKMIDEEKIFATINQRDGMVVFHDNPQKFDSANVLQKLREDMDECIKLTNLL